MEAETVVSRPVFVLVGPSSIQIDVLTLLRIPDLISSAFRNPTKRLVFNKAAVGTYDK